MGNTFVHDAADAALAGAAADGNRDAFGLLFERHLPAVFDAAWHVLHDREVAAEIARDTFAAAWRHIDAVPPEAFAESLLDSAHHKAGVWLEANPQAAATAAAPPTGDPPNVGVCTAPVCDTTAQCLPDETCHGGACRRPKLCDANGACPGETQCIGGPGGKCMPTCPSSGDCSTIHPALSCVTGLSPQPVCIELGAEPGWPCRPDGECAAAIDHDAVIDPTRIDDEQGLRPARQVCEEGICRYGCSLGSECSTLSDDLDCWVSGGICRPKGTFPGSICTPGGCSNVFVDGVEVPVFCVSASAISDQRMKCRVSCAQGGDALCAAADPLSACATELQDEAICLPAGSFSGSICDQGCDAIEYGSSSHYDLSCVDGQCRGACEDCAGISSGLTCASDGPAAGSCIPTP